MRGILYGLSFIVFEERIFWNCFRRFFKKCCCCCNKFGLDYLDLDDNDRENKELTNNQGEIKYELKDGKGFVIEGNERFDYRQHASCAG